MKRKIKPPIYGLYALLFLLAVLFLSSKLFAAEEQSAWFKDSGLEFSVRKDIVPDTKYPTTYGGRGNIDCSNLTLKKRDGVVISALLNLYKESSVSGCYIDSSVGPVDANGYVNVSGTDYAAEMLTSTYTPDPHMVFPGSDVYISRTSGSPAAGNYVWFGHLQSSMKIFNLPNGKIIAAMRPSTQVPLADKAGNMLPVMADNFSISDTGQWLIVDSPGRGILRIDLATMEILPFTTSFENSTGIGAALRTAISSDGRFAVVASKSFNVFKLFDLSTCSATPIVITAPVTGCRSLDLTPFVRSKINEMSAVLQIRFLTDELIKFYASYDITAGLKLGEFVVAAPGTYLTGMDYLGMGDSFSSGEGAHKYEIGTDVEDLNMCHLSKVSYPYLIAKRLQANNFHSVACSGARAVNVQGGTGISKDKGKVNRDNQYDNDSRPANDPLKEWAPGYRKQVSFISINNPKIVSVSVAGNDIAFSDKIIACLKPGTCFPTFEDRQEVFNEIDNKLNAFTATYKKLKEAATKNARIYVVGYPQIAKEGGNCGLNVHLNQDELTFAASVITRLNMVVKTAATNAEVNYVDIEDALNGFRLCENTAGNIAMNGLTAGKDIFNVVGNESFHPNEFGHELMANKILAYTNSLGNIDPITVAIKLPKVKDDDPALKKAPKTGRTLKKRVAAQPKAKTVKKGKKATVSLKGKTHALPPNTNLDVSLDGNHIGTVTTDDNGDVDVDVTIPPGSEPGPAVIDIVGTDITGEPIDIGTVIIVGEDGPDFDGDGIEDINDTCPGIVNAMVDTDQDGIDDSCDPNIGPTPPTPASSSNPSSTNPPASTTVDAGLGQLQSTADNSTNQSSATTSETNRITADDEPIISEVNNYQTLRIPAPIGKVLGATTANLHGAAAAANESLKDVSMAHPLAFSAILLTLLFILLALAYLYYRANTNRQLFFSAYSHPENI